MVSPKRPARGGGVSLVEVRAAVALAHLHGDGSGVAWSHAEWERLWVRLSPVQQRVVYLHALLGFTHTEIAAQLGVGRGSVDGLWRRALDRIRDALPN
jgi:DNA-directed RNA polymerase specialized sigma24 family protein